MPSLPLYRRARDARSSLPRKIARARAACVGYSDEEIATIEESEGGWAAKKFVCFGCVTRRAQEGASTDAACPDAGAAASSSGAALALDPSLAKLRVTRCGECAGCRASECKKCRACLDMVKFGGPGLMKRSCERRKCERLEGAKPADARQSIEDGAVAAKVAKASNKSPAPKPASAKKKARVSTEAEAPPSNRANATKAPKPSPEPTSPQKKKARASR